MSTMKKYILILFSMLVPILVSAQSTYDMYIKAAKKGDADAQFRIGSCYSKGAGVKKDFCVVIKGLRNVNRILGPSIISPFDVRCISSSNLYQMVEQVILRIFAVTKESAIKLPAILV